MRTLRFFRILRAAALGIAPAAVLSGCTKKAPPPKPAVAVTVAPVVMAPAAYVVRANGVVEPMQTVAVQSQVGGVLRRVAFSEGQEVTQGQILFEIDPRPFEAALAQARAVLARDEAQSENARREAERYSALVEKDFVTRSQADQAAANAVAQRQVVEADRAALANAQFNLDNATIRAPISGKSGAVMVRQGNLVKPGADPPLVVINQIHPILVRFTVPDRELPNVQAHSSGRALTVKATPIGEGAPEVGALNFIDNGIDTTSGTVTLKARFANERGRLWPGQFLATEIEIYVDSNALMVPDAAVQIGQDGPYVFVVGTDNKAELRVVTTVRPVGRQVLISRGLSAGERVVTDGQSRLVPGAVVDVREATDTLDAAAAAPAGKTRTGP